MCVCVMLMSHSNSGAILVLLVENISVLPNELWFVLKWFLQTIFTNQIYTMYVYKEVGWLVGFYSISIAQSAGAVEYTDCTSAKG